MSSKIKPRQQKKPRSLITRDMILNNHGGPMRDRRERRPKDAKRSWERDQDA
jgi:hypothetical protein